MKIAFQYWNNGGLQLGTLRYSDKDIKDAREEYLRYREAGNTIASWFEGTLAEAEEMFGIELQ